MLFTKLGTNIFVRIVLPKIQVRISETHYWEDYSLDDSHNVRFQQFIRKRMAHTGIENGFIVSTNSILFKKKLTLF